MQFQSGVNNNMLGQLLNPYEKNSQMDDDEEELEIKRKYYEKPDMESLEAADFLRGFIKGMG